MDRLPPEDSLRLVRSHADMLRTAVGETIDSCSEQLVATGILRDLSPVEVARLQAAMARHWSELFAHGVDADYLCRVTRIGIAHREHGIDPDIYMRTSGWLVARLAGSLADERLPDPTARRTLVTAVLELLTFDISAAIRAWSVALVD